MKSTIASLKRTTGSATARAVAASAVLVPLAAIAGGIKLSNHNETFLRDPLA